MEYQVLTVPGWHGSGAGHWQTLWEDRNPQFTRVEQRDWADPRLGEWMEAIESAVVSSSAPVVFAAHSLGSLAVAQWAERSERTVQVAAALLVAPPYLGCPSEYSEEMRRFFPAVPTPLPFRSVLVASQDDPYMPFDGARRLSKAWASELIDAGRAGHINTESGHGTWTEGQELLRSLSKVPGK